MKSISNYKFVNFNLKPFKNSQSNKELVSYSNYGNNSKPKRNNLRIKTDKSNPKLNLSPLNSHSYNKKINNKIPPEILEYIEKKSKNLNSNIFMKNITKTLEIFQAEIVIDLEKDYFKRSLKDIIKNKFDIIYQFLQKNLNLYESKYKEYISFIINLYNLVTPNNSFKIINNINKRYLNNYIFNLNLKSKLLKEEENIIKLINDLSTYIKTYNMDFKSEMKCINKLIEEIKGNLQNELESEYIKKNNIKNNITKIAKDICNLHYLFYNNSKDIFHQLKISNSNKFKFYNSIFNSKFNEFNDENSLKTNISISYQNSNIKRNLSKGIFNNGSKLNILSPNKSEKSTKKIKAIYNQSNDYNIKIINYKNNENISPSFINFAYKVNEFLKLIDELQESILHKKNNISQMKIEFSKSKSKLTKYCYNIIENKSEKSFNNNIFYIKHIIDFTLLYKYDKDSTINKNKDKDNYKNEYNQLLEEMSKQTQIILDSKSKLTEKIYENNELKAKIKKYEEEKQNYENKEQNENNLNINKEYIKNEENNSIANKNEIITKLIEEKNRLKSLIDNCMKIIFVTMKENSQDLIDEISNNENNEDNDNNNYDEDIIDNENIESYINFVNNNIKKFQSYNKEINLQLQKYKREANENSLRSKEYKDALEQLLNKNNNEEMEENDNIKEFKEKNENLTKINNFLIGKVKNLEKEIEEVKFNNKYITKNDKTKEELNDSSPVNINVDIEKYYGLLQLLEKEQEKNKLNEEKYLKIINEINNDKELMN